MRKKYILGTTAVILAVLLPLVFFLSITASVPPAYGETFVQALGDKFDRLTSVDEPKLILIGGSSVAFGFDSKMLEEALGMPVVNFGLYATLGTKLMMDLSKANIGKNDIILLSPEMDPQTLSLYFNAESTWQAMEGHTEMLRYIAKEDLPAMVGAYYEYGMQKFGYHKDGIKLSPTGVYRSDSFNAYGDIEYKRPYNTLYESTGLRYDTTTVINLTPDIVSDDFIDYVNEYIEWCKKKGATVYFSFCPMNKDALSETTDAEAMIAFFDYLSASLECTVIGSPEDTAYDAEYFYDTNYHLNDAGAILHTKEILNALYRQMGRTDLPRVQAPEKPAYPCTKDSLPGTITNILIFSFMKHTETDTPSSARRTLQKASRISKYRRFTKDVPYWQSPRVLLPDAMRFPRSKYSKTLPCSKRSYSAVTAEI